MTVTALSELRRMARGGPLIALLHRYTQAFFTQLSQSVACNRLHSLPERLARSGAASPASARDGRPRASVRRAGATSPPEARAD